MTDEKQKRVYLMKIKHLLVFFILLSGIAYSNQSFGIKTGINLSKTEYRLITDRKMIVTPSIEISYDLDMLKNKQFGISLAYSEQGLSFNSIYTDTLEVNLGTYKTTLKFHYFSIPIRIGYRMNNVIWSAGIDPSLFILGTVRGPEISNTDGFIGYKTETFNDGVNVFQIAAFIECKIVVRLSEKMSLSPVITYKHGLVNVVKENHFYVKHRGLSFSACLDFKLNN